MNPNEMNEKEINLIDMFWCVLGRIKIIVVLAIIGVVLGAAISYLKANDVADSQIVLDDNELMLLQSYDSACKAYDTQMTFNTSDRRMRYNVNNVHYQQLMYVIDAEDEHNTQVIAMVYTYDLNSDGDLKNAITVTTERVAETDEDGNELLTHYLLYVTVRGIDEADLDMLVSHVKELMSDAKSAVASQYGAHDLSLTVGNPYVGYEQSYLDFQQGQLNKVAYLNQSIIDIEAKYTDNLKAYIAAGGDITGEPITIPGQSGVRAISIKMVILGAFAGIFVGAGLVMFSYILNPYVRLDEELEHVLRLPILGYVVEDSVLKGIGKLRYKNIARLSKDERVDMVVASIKILASRSEVDTLYVTGAVMSDKERQVLALVQERLEASNIKLVIGQAILNNSAAMEEAAKVGCVLLAEQAGKSRFDDVEREIKQCNKLSINVLGAVILQ